MSWYLEVLKKYAVFNGRARRKELWMFVLFNILFSIVVQVVDLMLGSFFLTVLYMLVLFIPTLAVQIRRLHDIGRSGWWILIPLLPIIGSLILLYFFVKDGGEDANCYGESPKLVNA